MNTNNIDAMANALFDDEVDVAPTPTPQATVSRERLLEAALEYAAAGIPVFPLSVGGKQPAIPRSAGGKGLEDATCEEWQIRSWWSHNAYNIGIRCGQEHRLLVVDFDIPGGEKKPLTDDEQRAYDAFEAQMVELETLTATTRSGGRHYVFSMPQDMEMLGNRANWPTRCVDVRGEGGYIVASPSVVEGRSYRWSYGNINSIEIAPMWLMKLLAERKGVTRTEKTTSSNSLIVPSEALATVRKMDAGVSAERLRGEKWVEKKLAEKVREVSTCAAGGRNDMLNGCTYDIAQYAHAGWISGRLVQDSMIAAGIECGLSETECQNTVCSAFEKAQPKNPELTDRDPVRFNGRVVEVSPPTFEIDMTDSGNAIVWLEMFGDVFRVLKSTGKFLFWNGKTWVDGEAMALNSTEHVSRAWKRKADEMVVTDKDGNEVKSLVERRGKISAHALHTQSKSARQAMLVIAASEPGMVVSDDEMNNQPWLFNAANGTIDLRTGQIREFSSKDMLTTISTVNFDPSATCPTFEKFITQTIPDDDTRNFMKRFFGYGLSGVVKQHVFVVMHGELGRNGKGTLIRAVMKVGGSSMVPLTRSFLAKKSIESHPTSVASLKGVRLAISAEMNESDALDTGLVKEITGGDELRARYMYGDEFSFTPTHKLALQTNFIPYAPASDNAYWTRLRVIPFHQSFAGQENENLGDEIAAELPGVLNWLIEGCLLWQKEGLKPSKVMEGMLATVRAEADELGRFITDCCKMGKEEVTTSKDLHLAYTKWCEIFGIPESKRLSSPALTKQLVKRSLPGVEKKHAKAGTRWTGISSEMPSGF